MNTTDQIYEIVNRAKIDLENAQHKLKTSFNKIQGLAYNTINLSGGDATSRVAEIARKSKTASDEFYASCQALVFMIDHSCRGIINETVDTKCIREVLDTIKLLNSESEIQANFSGTFDDYNLGDLVSVTYTPSIESKMIQQFWESLYNSRPDVAEFNKMLEKEKKIAAKNKRKKDEERRLKKEEEQNRNAKMEEHYNKICEECKVLVRTYDASIDNIVKEQISLYKKEQEIFFDFVENSDTYSHWLDLFIVMLGTGCRIGEILGLTFADLDFKNNNININHSISYRPQEDGKCKHRISTPKTKKGTRNIPMLPEVKEALLRVKADQKLNGRCESVVDGYSGFVFMNRDKKVMMFSSVNKAIARIVKEQNKQASEDKSVENPVMLTHFTAHSFRHTFCTRLFEKSQDFKAIQELMGHADVQTTMNIYDKVFPDRRNQVNLS